VSAAAPLHQAGLVEWVAAVFALAGAGEQFVCCEPLADDLRVGPLCPDGSDGYLDISGGSDLRLDVTGKGGTIPPPCKQRSSYN